MKRFRRARSLMTRALGGLLSFVLVGAILVYLPSPTQASADESVVVPAAASAPTTVILTSTHASLQAGQSATLTARVDQPIEDSSSRLEIWNASRDTRIAECTSGVECAVVVQMSSGSHESFEARVNSITSNEVVVERAAWSVSLNVDKSVFSVGESVTLTAMPNQDIKLAQPYRVYVLDVTTDRTIGVCNHSGRGSNAQWADGACVVSTTFPTGPAHTYRAYVAQGASNVGHPLSGLTDVQAISNTFFAWAAGGPTLPLETAGGSKALHERGCSRGLKPPASRSDLAT